MNAGRILVSLLLGLSLAVPVAALPGEAWEGHMEAGQELLKQKQFEAAITELEKVQSMAPGESIEALYALSRAYGQAGRVADAIAACRDFTGAAADPELAAMAHNLLGICPDIWCQTPLSFAASTTYSARCSVRWRSRSRRSAAERAKRPLRRSGRTEDP